MLLFSTRLAGMLHWLQTVSKAGRHLSGVYTHLLLCLQVQRLPFGYVPLLARVLSPPHVLPVEVCC